MTNSTTESSIMYSLALWILVPISTYSSVAMSYFLSVHDGDVNGKKSPVKQIIFWDLI